MITESEVKMQVLQEEVKKLQSLNKLKEDATYAHLTSIIKTILVLWFMTIAIFVGGIAWYFSQFEIEVVDETTDIGSEQGNANYIKGEGNEINNG